MCYREDLGWLKKYVYELDKYLVLFCIWKLMDINIYFYFLVLIINSVIKKLEVIYWFR